MCDLDMNIYYFFIPFEYRSKKSIDLYLCDLPKEEYNCDELITFMTEVFKYSFLISSTDELEAKIHCFDTGVGFISLRFTLEAQSAPPEQYQDIIQENHPVLKALKEKYPLLQLFPSSRSCISYAIITRLYELRNDPYGDYKKNIDLGGGHRCYLDLNRVALVTNHLPYSLDSNGEKSADYLAEEAFRKKLDENLLMLILLLHHERQAYFSYRKRVIVNDNHNSRKVKALKEKLLTLTSNFSFNAISEDSVLQLIFSEYRELLSLSDYENTLSDLVYHLDEEIERSRDKKITIISLLIAVASLASVILDIYQLFN